MQTKKIIDLKKQIETKERLIEEVKQQYDKIISNYAVSVMNLI